MKKFPKMARMMLKIIRDPLAGALRSIFKSSPPLLLQNMESFSVELISISFKVQFLVCYFNECR